MKPDGSWGGLRRCDQLTTDDVGVFRRGHGDTRTHGIAMGDIDNDGGVDIFFNNGGFAHSDQVLTQGHLKDNPELTSMIMDYNNCTWKGKPPLKVAPDIHIHGKAHCDTRETAVIYSAPVVGNMAFVRLQLVKGAGPAVGARIRVSAPGFQRFHTVTSAQGFQSQNSFWVPVAMGNHMSVELEITWLGGAKSVHQVTAKDRVTIHEPKPPKPRDSDL